MSRPRLVNDQWPAAAYAIGDVHGYLDRLIALEEEIIADGDAIPGEQWLITLGDYVDRGPNSAGVISHLLEPVPKGWRRIALIGNHEDIMLQYLHDPVEHGYWLMEGGAQTLQSYGVDLGTGIIDEDDDLALHAAFKRRVPAEHLAFLTALPIAVSLPGWLFVHAGIRPGLPLDLQTDDDLIWIRAPFLTAQRHDGITVVHGHTPAREPVITPGRICLDTHCFNTGTLTGMRVTPDGRTKLFSASGPIVPWR
jgi:serine/threonine protein phosphatase 1